MSLDNSIDTHILVSTLQDSHLFRFEGGSRLAQTSSSSTALVTNEPTLALGNIPRRRLQKARPGQNSGFVYVDSSLVVQVTKTGVWLVEYEMALGQYTKAGDGWVPGRVQGV
jgi:DNA damage-binding protein 1